MTATNETGEQFAARYWGGDGVVPQPKPVSYGPRACDGGRQRFPAGWQFRADGFTYVVWLVDGVWHMQAQDDSFALFRRDGDHWVVDHGWDRRTTRELAR